PRASVASTRYGSVTSSVAVTVATIPDGTDALGEFAFDGHPGYPYQAADCRPTREGMYLPMSHDRAVPAKRHVGGRGSPEASPRLPLLTGGGFTLVEILVVMAIIATLSAMVMPLLSIIQQRVKVTTTQSVLRKADTAIRMFKTDLGAYPGRMGYPAAWSDSLPLRDFNRLFYHVGTNIAAADRQAILADAQSGAAMFSSPATAVTHLAGEIVNEPRSDWNASYRNGYATL